MIVLITGDFCTGKDLTADMLVQQSHLIHDCEKFEKIQNAHVAVFGIGGVGGYVVEALVRSGIQKIDIIDNDTVSLTNINRQIIATHSTIGKYKVDVMKARILDINPNAHVNCFKCFSFRIFLSIPGEETSKKYCSFI